MAPGTLPACHRSVIRVTVSVAEHIEITVSDGSDDGATGKVAERLLATWPGRRWYIWNHHHRGLALLDNLSRAPPWFSNQRWSCTAPASNATACST
jgi:hypothetical protein